MAKKGAKRQAKDHNVSKRSLKDFLENLDQKSRRRIDYLIKDFKLQRQNALNNIDECKEHYFILIDTYYNKIPKIVPRRYLLMKCGDFELENSYLTIDYKKFIDRTQFASALNCRKEILKYGGTPAKFKVTYSATKRKSIVKSEIRNFELKRLSATGNKTIITSVKKRTIRKSTIKRSLISSIKKTNNINSLLDNQQSTSTDTSLDDAKLKERIKFYKLSKIKDDKHQLEKEIKNKQLKNIDTVFNQVLENITEQDRMRRINGDEQKRILKLFGF